MFRYPALFLFLGLGLTSFAQQSLSIREADSLFLRNNLLLLASKYRVDAQKALILQAKLFNNPTFNTEFNLYNPDKAKFFDVGKGKNGEKILGINQLINIAGQRNKRVRLAREQAHFTELEFNELLRTLKLTLRSSFYTLHYSTSTIVKYDNQISLLGSLVNAYDEQTKKGNIALKELMRLRVVYFQLQNDRAAVYSDLLENYKLLQTLLGTNDSIQVRFDSTLVKSYNIPSLDGTDIYLEAVSNRSDLKQSESMLRQTEANRTLQRSLAYPDLHLGALYDQQGNYIINYTGITFAFDLPVFNRNQGNIRSATALVRSAEQDYRNKEIEVKNEVKAALHNLFSFEDIYQKNINIFDKDFELLNRGYIENFQKRNISLIEFIDFFEAYNANIFQQNELQLKRIRAYEELNFAVGRELFAK